MYPAFKHTQNIQRPPRNAWPRHYYATRFLIQLFIYFQLTKGAGEKALAPASPSK